MYIFSVQDDKYGYKAIECEKEPDTSFLLTKALEYAEKIRNQPGHYSFEFPDKVIVQYEGCRFIYKIKETFPAPLHAELIEEYDYDVLIGTGIMLPDCQADPK